MEWTNKAQETFQKAKRLLAAAVPLQHPSPNAELSLATDASDTHIGSVMQQKSGDHWRLLGFFSRQLTDTESRYSTFDRELLAAFDTIQLLLVRRAERSEEPPLSATVWRRTPPSLRPGVGDVTPPVWLIFTVVLLLYGTDDLSSGREPRLLRHTRGLRYADVFLPPPAHHTALVAWI